MEEPHTPLPMLPDDLLKSSRGVSRPVYPVVNWLILPLTKYLLSLRAGNTAL